MRLWLLRHGNTFEAGETSRWVGASEDLPLTGRGREQAREAAEAFGADPARLLIVTGPLLRTRETADIIAAALPSEIRVDDRLCEIDYGAWGGKSDAEIAADSEGAALLAAWRDEGRFPPAGVWAESEDGVVRRVREALRDVLCAAPDVLGAADRATATLLISSNGILRLIPELLVSLLGRDMVELPKGITPRASVKTGHGCVIDLGDDGRRATMRAWNVRGAALQPGPR